MSDFDTFYGSNPWANLDKNERRWYDPNLVELYRQRSVFSGTIPFAKDMKSKRSRTMTITQLLDVHPDSSPLSMRQLWMPAAHIDSRAVEVTFNRYGGKVAFHEFDDLITYWKKDNKAGIRRILNGALGHHMIDVLDILARNAYIKGALDSGFNLMSGGGIDFSALGTADVFDPKVAMDVWLGMSYRDVPAAQGVNGAGASILAYTSPGVIHDIQGDDAYKAAVEYANPKMATKYEAGAYKNVRFQQTPKCTLYNCGEIIARAPVSVAISAGDGSPDPTATKVDGTYMVGQDGMTHYITLGTFTTGLIDDLAVGDVISIHASTTSAWGVTDGVNFQEGKLHNLRIVSIDTDNGRLAFDRPVMVDFTTDLGGGTFAYITKGRHIHTTIFVAAPTGLVSGISVPPRTHTPPPVDDFESIYRFSWDAYLGHQLYQPEVFEVVFSAGSFRYKGNKVIQ